MDLSQVGLGQGIEAPRGFSPAELSALVNELVVDGQRDDAAQLWHLREHAIRAPHYTLADFADIDDRLEAHLEAQVLAGPLGLELAQAALDGGGAGELFCLSALALIGGDRASFERALSLADDPDLGEGLSAALAWLPFGLVEPWIAALLPSVEPSLARVAVAACANHRRDLLGDRLGLLCTAADPALRARSLRAVGELGRADLLAVVAQIQGLAPDDPSQLAAIESALRLGQPIEAASEAKLWAWIVAGHDYARRSTLLVARSSSPALGRAWYDRLRGSAPHRRAAIELAGQLGDPALVDELIGWMPEPELARAAGAALRLITGIDLAYHDLDRDPPEDFESGPNDDPDDENVALDLDDDLAWPDAELVAKWWSEARSRFAAGARLLGGEAPTHASLASKLLRAPQLLRGPAAFELARREPRRPSVELRAPAARQRRAIAEAAAR